MKNRLFSIQALFFSCVLVMAPYKQAISTGGEENSAQPALLKQPGGKNLSLPDSVSFDHELTLLYDSLNLRKAGLDKKVFAYALKGYFNLAGQNKINRTGIITICDFSQSSRRKRMYLIDIENYELLMQTHVAHGKNSGAEYARRFSNKPESLQSSLGFYVTRNTYYGGHGLSLMIDGMEPGINDKARTRKIVVHGSRYVGNDYLRFCKYIGRSFGCPAVPARQSGKIINTIKNGTCFFIYHPTRQYIETSKILNG
jgi:hypothetical protein